MSHASEKNVDSDQPAQSTQADLGRNCLPLLSFLHIKGSFYHRNQPGWYRHFGHEFSPRFETLSQTTNFRLFQTERDCRRQF